MEIKKNLKSLDIKISKLATELGVSRPTLDAYIEYYENGQQIPNEGYQKIFEYLFSGEEINSVEFAQRYDYVKRVMLADARTGAELSIQAKRENAVVKNIIDILDSGTLEEPLVEFINLFINNKDKDLVKAIYYYFNFTNGFIDLSNVDVEEKNKALFSQLSKLFNDYQNDSIELLPDYYEQIVDKNKRIFDKKKIKVNDSDIIEYIKNNLNESSNLNIEVLKQMIASREDK